MACSKAKVCWSQISSLPQVNVPQILIGSILNFGTGGVSIGGKKRSKAKTLESEYQLFRTYTSRLCFLSDVDLFPEILGPNDWEGMSLLWHIAPILLMVTPNRQACDQQIEAKPLVHLFVPGSLSERLRNAGPVDMPGPLLKTKWFDSELSDPFHHVQSFGTSRNPYISKLFPCSSISSIKQSLPPYPRRDRAGLMATVEVRRNDLPIRLKWPPANIPCAVLAHSWGIISQYQYMIMWFQNITYIYVVWWS